jgi:hypothetical protein
MEVNFRSAILKKFTSSICLAITVSGCGLALQSQKDAAIERCHQRFPTFERTTAVERVRCENAAFDIMRSSLGNGDLFDLHHTSAVVIAERFQNGQITQAEAEQQLASLRSNIVSEADRRDTSGRAANAASNAALINAGAALMSSPQPAPPMQPMQPIPRPITTTCSRMGIYANCTTY